MSEQRNAAGDLDEAVQALKATTEAGADPTGPADSRTNGANLLEDDELKPSFMRRTASDRSPPSQGRAAQTQGILQSGHVDKEAGSSDLNPRPLTRRRTEPSNAARQAKAKAVLQVGTAYLHLRSIQGTLASFLLKQQWLCYWQSANSLLCKLTGMCLALADTFLNIAAVHWSS